MSAGEGTAYVIITPVKNEEKYIHYLIDSIINQTMKPAVWVIVDDGCTDRTIEIVKDAQMRYNWIHIESLDRGDWALGKHYSEVCLAGFNFAQVYCKNNGIDWNFIGLVDGDMKLVRNYFEMLINKFGDNEKLGIASGSLFSLSYGKFKCEKLREDLPVGGARLWRRECFQDAGYLPVISSDIISIVKSNLKGWDTGVVKEVIAFQMRPLGSSQGLCKGSVYRGKCNYFLGSPPIFIILKSFKLITQFPFFHGLCFWFGYFVSYLKKMERIKDDDIFQHYNKTKLQVIKRVYRKKIKQFFRVKDIE